MHQRCTRNSHVANDAVKCYISGMQEVTHVRRIIDEMKMVQNGTHPNGYTAIAPELALAGMEALAGLCLDTQMILQEYYDASNEDIEYSRRDKMAAHLLERLALVTNLPTKL